MLQPDGFERRKKIYDAQRTLRRSRLTGHPYFQVRASAPTAAVADQCSEILKGQFPLLQMLRVMGQAPRSSNRVPRSALGRWFPRHRGRSNRGSLNARCRRQLSSGLRRWAAAPSL